MVINFVTEFLFDKFVVFRGSEDTNDVAQKQAEKNAVSEGEALQSPCMETEPAVSPDDAG